MSLLTILHLWRVPVSRRRLCGSGEDEGRTRGFKRERSNSKQQRSRHPDFLSLLTSRASLTHPILPIIQLGSISQYVIIDCALLLNSKLQKLKSVKEFR